MKISNIAATCIAFLASVTALATYSPGPTYSLGIPPSTAASGKGNIYFQLSAPNTYRWVGLGIGSRMAGATIFVMYSDGKGNVTVSGRGGGQGHVEPKVDADRAAGLDVKLLEGSGVEGGVMRGNVLCTNCPLLSTTSSSSQWIAAWMVGDPIDSTSPSYSINQHNDDSYRQFTYDLSTAAIDNDSNPFISLAATSSSSSRPASSVAAENQSSASKTNKYNIAHGTIMSITMIILFPLGALSMMFGKFWVHVFIQGFGLALLIVGFALGVRLAEIQNLLFTTPAKTHTIFGLVIFILFLLQFLLGLYHHHKYKQQQRRGWAGVMHIWYGRTIIVLGIVNGGVGLQLAGNSTAGKVVYGVVAGVVGLAYAGWVGLSYLAAMWWEMWRKEKGADES
ncbi:hypothetical protein ACMFMG_007928 [Clarireedia jacksonii]